MHALFSAVGPETSEESVQATRDSSVMVPESCGLPNVLKLGHDVAGFGKVCERRVTRTHSYGCVHSARLADTSNSRPAPVIGTREGHDVVLTGHPGGNRNAPVEVFGSGQDDLVLVVGNARRLSPHLGQQDQVGFLDLFRFDLPQPSAPVVVEGDGWAGESPAAVSQVYGTR
jgi:hypothetical protein